MSLLCRTLKLARLKDAIQNISRNLNTTSIQPPVQVSALNLNFNNSWIYKEQDPIKTPFNHIKPIKLPNDLFWLPIQNDPPKLIDEIEAPPAHNNEIQAARLIVIRRKKMKKHKLKKFRKRMRFEHAKIRQRRELKKEKEFQATLILKCKEAEAFSAEKYVQERLDKLHEIIIPKYWKGKRMPEFLIREKMGLPPKK